MIIVPSNVAAAERVSTFISYSNGTLTNLAGDMLVAFSTSSSSWGNEVLSYVGGGNGMYLWVRYKIATSANESFPGPGAVFVVRGGKSIGATQLYVRHYPVYSGTFPSWNLQDTSGASTIVGVTAWGSSPSFTGTTYSSGFGGNLAGSQTWAFYSQETELDPVPAVPLQTPYRGGFNILAVEVKA